MNLKMPVLVAAAVGGLAIANLSGGAVANQPDQREWRGLSAEDRADLLDARIAALKTGLKLTPEQEKNWQPLEDEIRAEAKARAERFAQWREKRGDGEERGDLLERLQRRSERMTERAAELQKLIGAAKPLYESLDDGQKRRFAELMRAGREQRRWRREG